MMRKILFQMIVNNPKVVEIFGDRVYEKGSVPSQPKKPFLVTRFLDVARGPAIRVQSREAEIWIYGPENDYTIIERGLYFLNQNIHRRTGVYVDEEGIGRYTLIDAAFLSAGPDLEDPDYRATLKVARYRLVGGTQ